MKLNKNYLITRGSCEDFSLIIGETQPFAYILFELFHFKDLIKNKNIKKFINTNTIISYPYYANNNIIDKFNAKEYEEKYSNEEVWLSISFHPNIIDKFTEILT